MKPEKPKILIAAGGSGGHLFPAQQFADYYPDVIFAGHKLANSPFFKKEFPFQEIKASPPKNIFRFIYSTCIGLIQSLRLFYRHKIEFVVGFGSFHTFPVLLAATLLRKKVILFEANCSLGKVNRLFSPFAQKIAIQFPVSAKRTVLVPLLPWTLNRQIVTKEEALLYFGLKNQFTILIFGGSQGASFFNEIMPKVVDYQVIHFTGRGKVQYENGCVKEFETRMDLAYRAADLVICRSGASTIAELMRHCKPSLLIPYPYSTDGHQKQNAIFFTNIVKGGRMLDQNEATEDRIRFEIEHLKKDYLAYEKSLRDYDVGTRVEIRDLLK